MQIFEGSWMYNEDHKDDLGPVEQVGIVRTGTRHKRGYEFQTIDLTVDQDQQEYSHQIFNCLLELERFKDQNWQPRFDRSPAELSI